MEIIIIAVVAVVLGAVIYSNRNKGLDLNKDGKLDIADAKLAVKNTVAEAKSAADVNKDGKVDKADAKVVAAKVKTTAKKAGTAAKTAAGKAKAAVKKVKKTK